MGPKQKFKVSLSEEEGIELKAMLRRGEHHSRKLKRVKILIHSNEGVSDQKVADLVDCRRETVLRIRRRYFEEGLSSALEERARPGAKPKLNAKGEALLIALACSDAPEGRESWTMQLLANKMIELGIVDEISDETVRRSLKKKTQAMA